jgi:hypothetical protein
VQEKMPLPLRPQEWKADALERLCSISAYYLLQTQNASEMPMNFLFLRGYVVLRTMRAFLEKNLP